MRRNQSSLFEEVMTSDAIEAEAAWPELRSVLQRPANSQDLGLWRLAEDSARWARRRPPALVRLTPPKEPRSPDFPPDYPDFPDAA